MITANKDENGDLAGQSKQRVRRVRRVVEKRY
jgi:hypothetical protein